MLFMKKFVQEFIIYTLTNLKSILSDPDQIVDAQDKVCQGNLWNARYELDCISNKEEWATQDRAHFSVAFAEAVAQTEANIISFSDNTLKQIFEIKEEFLKKIYIPQITNNTEPKNRLASVINNIDILIEELLQLPIEQEQVQDPEAQEPEQQFVEAQSGEAKLAVKDANNKFTFFAAAGIITAGLFIASAVGLSNKK